MSFVSDLALGLTSPAAPKLIAAGSVSETGRGQAFAETFVATRSTVRPAEDQNQVRAAEAAPGQGAGANIGASIGAAPALPAGQPALPARSTDTPLPETAAADTRRAEPEIARGGPDNSFGMAQMQPDRITDQGSMAGSANIQQLSAGPVAPESPTANPLPTLTLSQANLGVGPNPSQSAAYFQPPQSVIVASAAELPEVIARASQDNRNESLLVQLDPPELGRVAIDFRFDAQGLQHVTVIAESAEALRQIRHMHSELLQALERNGLSTDNMSFQQQTPDRRQEQHQPMQMAISRYSSEARQASEKQDPGAAQPNPAGLTGAPNGRLDIRV